MPGPRGVAREARRRSSEASRPREACAGALPGRRPLPTFAPTAPRAGETARMPRGESRGSAPGPGDRRRERGRGGRSDPIAVIPPPTTRTRGRLRRRRPRSGNRSAREPSPETGDHWDAREPVPGGGIRDPQETVPARNACSPPASSLYSRRGLEGPRCGLAVRPRSAEGPAGDGSVIREPPVAPAVHVAMRLRRSARAVVELGVTMHRCGFPIPRGTSTDVAPGLQACAAGLGAPRRSQGAPGSELGSSPRFPIHRRPTNTL